MGICTSEQNKSKNKTQKEIWTADGEEEEERKRNNKKEPVKGSVRESIKKSVKANENESKSRTEERIYVNNQENSSVIDKPSPMESLNLLCPKCEKYMPSIKSIVYDSNQQNYLVKYECFCQGGFQEVPLTSLISPKAPDLKCPLHQENKINSFCRKCKTFICQSCASQSHQKHDIYSSTDLYKKYFSKNSIGFKVEVEKEVEQRRKLFRKEIDQTKSYVEDEINKIISELGKVKEQTLQQLEKFCKEYTNIFYAIQTLYTKIPVNSYGSVDPRIYKNLKNFKVQDLSSKSILITNKEQFIEKLCTNKRSDEPLSLKCMFNFVQKGSQYKILKTFEGHQDIVTTVIELSNGKLATCSEDKTIKIWNSLEKKAEATLKGEESFLCLCELDPQYILSGGKDGIVKKWSLQSKEVEMNYLGHTKWIYSIVKIDNIYFASGSTDGMIKVWNHESWSDPYKELREESRVISLILLKNGRLCSGNDKGKITIWDWKKGKMLNSFVGSQEKACINCLCELEDRSIAYGTSEKYIKLWHESKDLITLQGHCDSIRSICSLSSNYFASGSFDKCIKIWDTNTKKCIQTLKEHKDIISCVIKLRNGNLVSASGDKTIKIWEKKAL